MFQEHFNTRNNSLSLQGLKCSFISENHAAQNSRAELYDILEALDSLDSQTVNDPNDSEAHVIMDLARAKREVFRAEQLLADCVVREHEVMASLFKIRAATSEKRLGLDAAGDELRVDCVIVASPSQVNGSNVRVYRTRNVTIQLD
ncbi:hypothetical protein DEU56DRAFT_917666 [Suillus clintonianus]|uniref:uncharacterized protein n=1 Tax=Suillus clintonianus TaxID=1904413 RepID=UPI001B864660|nr:uncharacterized protein DEU56DRAFT_917666 [Suillus clintonianus]KAG2122770.1 hypothetical protein DEU56DRAFT_917666 [Suillus clintonianus]